MSYKLVQWALQRAPLLPAGRGGGASARLNLIARCEEQRDGQETHCLSVSMLMHRTGLSAPAIKASTKALEAAGLIVRKGTKDGIPRYSINSSIVREDRLVDFMDARKQSRGVTEEPPSGVTEEPPRGGLPGNPGVTEEPPLGVTREPHSRPVKEERTTTADAVVGADAKPTKPPRKTTAPKDPAKDAAAHDLADRYYRAMSKQVNFIAVRGIVRRALDTFTAEQVMAGLKAMSQGGNRNRKLTRQTLLTAIEQPAQATHRAATVNRIPLPAVGEYPDHPFGETA